MTTRRTATLMLATAGVWPLMRPGVSVAKTTRSASGGGSYAHFLDTIRVEARHHGVPDRVLDEALDLSGPNTRVLQLDRHQPEFTLTWAQYRDRVITKGRQEDAARNFAAERQLLTGIWERYKVDPRVVVGIWGLESNFGGRMGSFNVVDALATLAFDGRRASFFHSELLTALRILGSGDVAPSRMIGSYAGAMGQPQFMPSAYLRFAVDYDGDGRRDIWTSRSDVFASIANYLSKSGWVSGEPWGQQVTLTRPIEAAETGRQNVRTLGAWEAAGVRRQDGGRFSRPDVAGALLLPDGSNGDAFMVYRNFNAIRRYNPSDFYALAVGLIGSSAA